MNRSIALIFLSLVLLFGQSLCAQRLDRERINLHVNSNLFLTGETLYFKVYCLDATSGEPGDLSRVAYVELVDANRAAALQTKLTLQGGFGWGDFFLPSSLPSGNYTLIAYTRWMRNFPVSDIFRKEITIINPFNKGLTESKSTEVNGSRNETSSGDPIDNAISSKSPLMASLEKKSFGRREKVTILLSGTDSTGKLNLSLSVHKADSSMLPSIRFKRNPIQVEKLTSVRFLPDLRGDLITGTVRDKSTQAPLVLGTVFLSAPSLDYVFMVSETDSAGRFYFNTKGLKPASVLLLQLGSGTSFGYAIQIDDGFLEDYSAFAPSPLRIDVHWNKLIRERSVYNQIENAFYLVKKDSVVKNSDAVRFYGRPDRSYKFDDYTRFPTLEDIFREYVPEVVVRKRKEKFELRLINSRNGNQFDDPPLILLDGIPVQDTDVIMKYDPLKIRSMDVVRRRYFYSSLQTDGIISLSTYDGEGKDLQLAGAERRNFMGTQMPKVYYSPIYGDQAKDLSRVPDYRVQLNWIPEIVIEGNKKKVVEFYTGDVEGDFVVEVEGIGSDGRRVHVEEKFRVTDRE